LKYKVCGKDLDSDTDEDKDNETIGYGISDPYSNDLCGSCWYEATTYGHGNNGGDTRGKTTTYNSSTTITTIEYLLSCIKCKYQTGYSYLWFSIQDGREHVLTSGHKLVTISEIIWEEDKALEIIQIDIKLVYDD
jgi:hypothetical protein